MSLNEKGMTTIRLDMIKGYGHATAPAGHDYIDRVFLNEPVFTAQDVREAVKELKEQLRGWMPEEIWVKIFGGSVNKIIDEIFGEKLI